MSAFDAVPRLRRLDVIGRRVLVRADLDVTRSPQGAVLDDAPLRLLLPTLRPLLAQRAKVILAATYSGDDSPEGVAARLGELLGLDVPVLGKAFEVDVRLVGEGQLALTPSLEGLVRQDAEAPEKKEWAERVAASIDVYVLDGLHAAQWGDPSVVELAPLLVSRAVGPLVAAALDIHRDVVVAHDPPYALVLGGASVKRLLPLVTALLPFCTDILVGGPVGNTFLAAQGWQPGGSPYDPSEVPDAKEILRLAASGNVKVHLPVDAVVREQASRRATPTYAVVRLDRELRAEEAALDVAIETCNAYRAVLCRCTTALWVGLMGDCSIEETQSGSLRVGHAVSEARRAFAAGEDTVGGAYFFALDGRLRAVPGGESGLDLLSGQAFPGLEALKR